MIIAFVNEKGGAGKTTVVYKTAALFYMAAEQQGKKSNCCLIDLDKQQTAVLNHFKLGIGEFPVLYPKNGKGEFDDSEENILSVIEDAKKQYKLIFIDMAGKFENKTVKALRNVDICIIPFQASVNDVATTVNFVKLLEMAEKALNRQFKKIALLRTRIKGGSNDLITTSTFSGIMAIKEKHYMFDAYIKDLQDHKLYNTNNDLLYKLTDDFAIFIKELNQLMLN